jgi:hypothetical protein
VFNLPCIALFLLFPPCIITRSVLPCPGLVFFFGCLLFFFDVAVTLLLDTFPFLFLTLRNISDQLSHRDRGHIPSSLVSFLLLQPSSYHHHRFASRSILVVIPQTSSSATISTLPSSRSPSLEPLVVHLHQGPCVCVSPSLFLLFYSVTIPPTHDVWIYPERLDASHDAMTNQAATTTIKTAILLPRCRQG